MGFSELQQVLKDVPPPLMQLQAPEAAYIVGGWLRDAWWGVASRDLDLALAEPLTPKLEELGALFGAQPFELNRRFGSYRIAAGEWTLDISPLHGGTIAEDIRRRDYTINTLALPCARLGAELTPDDITAHPEAQADLDSRSLRAVSDANLAADPLRVLRGYRLAAQHSLVVADEARSAWRELAARVLDAAAERVREELIKLFSASRPVVPAVEMMAADGVLWQLYPGLEHTRGCSQDHQHNLHVWEHTLSALNELETLRQQLPPELVPWRGELDAAWTTPVGSSASGGALTRLALLLHDIGKPVTREQQPGGRITFYEHQQAGVELVVPQLSRLKFATAEQEFIALMIAEHLRLGFYSEHDPLPPRLIYRYIRRLGRATPLAVLHSLADCRSHSAGWVARAYGEHVRAAAQVLRSYYSRDAVSQPPVLLDGRQIMELAGLREGPEVGRLKQALLEATAAGEVADEAGARAFIRRELAAGDNGDNCST